MGTCDTKPPNPNRRKGILLIKAFKIVLKIIFKGKGVWKSPIFLWPSIHRHAEKENYFLASRGQGVFLILKSYIYELSNSTMGCHAADANLRASLNFSDHAHSIWMNSGVL